MSNRLWASSDVRHNTVRKSCLCHRAVGWVHFQLCSQCCPSRCACHGIWGCLWLTAGSLHLSKYITLICTGTNKPSLVFIFFFFLSPQGLHCINVKQNWPTMLNYVPARDAASPPTTRRNIGAKKNTLGYHNISHYPNVLFSWAQATNVL